MRSARPGNVGERGASHQIWAGCRGVRGPSAPGRENYFPALGIAPSLWKTGAYGQLADFSRIGRCQVLAWGRLLTSRGSCSAVHR